jgi:hypothetical protein
MVSLVLPLAIALLGVATQSATIPLVSNECANGAVCTGTLIGTVTLAEGGAPVGATVFLQPLALPNPVPSGGGEYVLRDDEVEAMSRGHFHGIVGARGKVQISDVPPGKYIPVIQIPGYISPESLPSTPQLGFPDHTFSKQADNTVTVRAGAVTTFHLRLQHGGRIAGTARFEDGQPAQAALSLINRRFDGSFGYVGGIGAAHADATGRFAFANLAPGDYVVMTALSAPTVRTTQGLASANGGLVFSGNTSRLSRASIIHLIGTEIENTEMVLPTTGLRSVSGSVLAPDGSPLTQGLVRIQPVGDSLSAWMIPISSIATPIASDGSFHFYSLLPDLYEVWLQTYPSSTIVGITADHHGVRMKVTPTRYVSPHVLVDLSSAVTKPVVLHIQSAKDRISAPSR